MVIYKITNLKNNKIYIGQTNNLKRRIQQHKNLSKYNNTKPLYKDMQKYGFDSFKFEVLAETDNNYELNRLEKYYIQKYNAIEIGYNVQEGGNVMHIPEYITKHNKVMQSKEVRDKISKSMKLYRENNDFTAEHRQNLSIAMQGNHNFGDGDTRSIECYCIDDKGIIHNFHNYLEAGKWWHKEYNPFNCVYNYGTYRRKIIDCINKGYCYFGREPNKIKVDNIQWFNCVERLSKTDD